MSLRSIERILKVATYTNISLFFPCIVLILGESVGISGTHGSQNEGFIDSFLTSEDRWIEEPDSGLKRCHQDVVLATSVQWRTGEELDKHLKLAISVTFEEAPLREQLIKFSRHERIGLFVDRRVDSSQQISIRAVDKTFEQILWMIGEEKKLGICRLGNVFYVGPEDVAPTLQVLWEQLVTEPDQGKKTGFDWTKKSPVQWPFLSEPALILKRLSEASQFTVEQAGNTPKVQAEVLPHDVWPETLLPDLQLNEQIGLLVVGFGNWFELSNRGLKLVPFPQVSSGQLDWTVENPGSLLKRLKKEFPKSKISLVKGKTIRGVGTPVELAAIQKFIVFDQGAEIGKEKIFSLNTTASRGQILNSIAHQTGRKFEYSPESKKLLNEQIKVNVKDVNLEKLIKATLEGSELQFKLEKERLLIR